MSADSAVSIAWDLLKWAVTAIKRPIRYVMSSKSFAEGLQEEVQNLENEVQRVHFLVEQARNNARKFLDVFTTWEKKSDDALKEVQDLLGDFENATKTCCYGTLPDLKCRYQFSRKAEGKIKVIRELAQKFNGFKELDDFFSLFVLGDDGVFESRAMMIQNIMDALAYNINSVVGVYGMGGVGKSTLLVDVQRIIKKNKSFDLVAKADVSENPDIKTIQGELADALGLTEIKNKETTNGRAELLHERLKDEEKKKKKVLIILDNLWKGLELKSVGIPCGRDNKVIGCKLLLTSRFRNVLQSEMSCDKAFALDGLEEKEAKILFERIVGQKVHNDEFRPLVDEALRRCAGLPLLLDAMAKQLKFASLPKWRDALKQIEWSTSEGISGGINKVLQLSYDHLESEDAKSLLQLCVAYGVSKPSIENLVRYGYGLGIFQKDSRMEEARDRLSTLIYTLQASSLLLDNEGTDGLKIHDLVQYFVAQSVLRDHTFLVLKEKDMWTTQLQKERLKSCSALCFHYIDMKELPKELDCPELRIFLLFTNNGSLKIPYSYFNSMRKLVVLHLTSVCITHSPMPFPFLKDLRTLCLQHCSLEDVAILGKLKGLQVLSCVNSNFQRLPKEIGQLTELRLLDLNYCSNLQMIEPGVLGRLIKLEELYMERSFNQWNPVEQTQPTNASLIELNHLKNLCTLHVSIPDPSALPKDLDVKKLTKYKIRIGNAQRLGKDLERRILHLKLDPIIDVLRKGCIQCILSKTDDLFLTALNGSEQSICALSQEGFPKLKYLLVENSSSIQYILQYCSLSAFEMLESLLLIKLNNLTKICYSHISSSKSFGKLKVIQVESCDKMEVLFPLSLLRELPQLEEIKVVSCKLMHGIVDVDDCGKAELQNLRIMNLHQLPNIKNFFTTRTTLSSSTSKDQVGTQIAFFNGQQVAFPRLETLEIIGLDSLKFIFFPSMVKSLAQLKKLTISDCEKTEAIIMEEEGLGMETSEILAFPMLTDLHLERLKSLTCFSHGKCARESGSQDRVTSCATVLFNQEDSRYIQHLQTLDVSHCDGLSNMFTPTMAKNLVALTKLRISNCRILTEVISDEKGGYKCVVAFNQLKYMELDGLIGLRSFSLGGYTLMFPLLEDVIVTICPNMKFFSQGSIEALKLKRVQVSKEAWFWAGNLNITIQNMFEEMGTLVGVEKMLLSEFPRLIGKWHNELNPIKSHWQLISVVVDKCPSFINAIPSRLMLVLENLRYLQVRDCELLEEIFDLEGFEVVESTRILPRLWELNLANLPKLRQLWKRDLQESLCFNSLRSLILYNCSNLGHAFSPSMAQCLANLELMEIKECGQMEGVIVEEEGEGSAMEKITFSKLWQMTMEYLPNLTCFLLGKNCMLECPKLEMMIIAHCPKMESLIGQSWMEDDHGTPSFFTSQVIFPRLETLEITGLDDLRFMFLPSMVKSLAQLRELRVSDCMNMEAIITEEEGWEMEASEILAFPMLTDLHLQRLKCVTCFFRTKYSQEARSEDDFNSRSIALFNQEVAFPGLKTLEINGLDNLRFMFLPSMIKSLAQLRELRVSDCMNMEVIITEEEGWGMEASETLAFPMLTELHLQGLERVTCFSCTKCSQEAQSHDGFNSRSTTLFNQEVAFPNLETLEIFAMSNINMIWDNQVYFRHLKTLNVSSCDGLSHIFTPTIVGNLVELKSLTITSCKILTQVMVDGGGEEGHVVAFKQLKYLKLHMLAGLKCFSSGRYTLVFPLLEDVMLVGCLDVKFFSEQPIEAPKLDEVTKREMWFWKDHLNVISQNLLAMVVDEKKMQLSEFPTLIEKWHSQIHLIKSSWQLESLTVDKCPSFINAIPSGLMLVLDNMKTLQVHDCESVEEIFDLEGLEGVERTLPSFMTLDLVNLPKLRRLWNKDLQGMLCFNSLQGLTLYKCNNLRHAFTQSMARSLANLQWMEIKECNQMEGVIGEEEEQGIMVEKVPFSNLDRMKLECLPNLTSFLSRKNHTLDNDTPSLFTPQVVFPSLKKLHITDIGYIKMIWGNHIASSFPRHFQYLKTLDVSHCMELSSMFTSTMARNLVELTKLRISNCRMLTEIISDEGCKEGPVVAFKQLKYMELDELTGLTCFSSGRYTFLFPLLEVVIVTGCPNMKFFSKAPLRAPKLKGVPVSTGMWFWNGNIGYDMQNMSINMAMVDGVEFMHLSGFSGLTEKWHNKLMPIKSSWQLKSLVVDNCPSFLNAIPSRLMLVLDKINTLQVQDCELLEEIFDLEGLNMQSTCMLPQLWCLNLVNLPKLRQLWNKNLQGTLCVNSLSYLTLYNCSNLRHAFTPSMVQCLPTLQWMEIKECSQLERVIAEEGEGSEVEKVIFPTLNRMELESLSNLTSFSSGKNHTMQCLMLQKLTIARCPKIITSTWQSLMKIDQHISSPFPPQVIFAPVKSMVLSHIDNSRKAWVDDSQHLWKAEPFEKLQVEFF